MNENHSVQKTPIKFYVDEKRRNGSNLLIQFYWLYILSVKQRRENPKVRKRLSTLQTHLLRSWFNLHIDSPYPSKRVKHILAKLVGRNKMFINTWFYNQRRTNPLWRHIKGLPLHIQNYETHHDNCINQIRRPIIHHQSTYHQLDENMNIQIRSDRISHHHTRSNKKHYDRRHENIAASPIKVTESSYSVVKNINNSSTPLASDHSFKIHSITSDALLRRPVLNDISLTKQTSCYTIHSQEGKQYPIDADNRIKSKENFKSKYNTSVIGQTPPKNRSRSLKIIKERVRPIDLLKHSDMMKPHICSTTSYQYHRNHTTKQSRSSRKMSALSISLKSGIDPSFHDNFHIISGRFGQQHHILEKLNYEEE